MKQHRHILTPPPLLSPKANIQLHPAAEGFVSTTCQQPIEGLRERTEYKY